VAVVVVGETYRVKALLLLLKVERWNMDDDFEKPQTTTPFQLFHPNIHNNQRIELVGISIIIFQKKKALSSQVAILWSSR
jgi:hypothetical protein